MGTAGLQGASCDTINLLPLLSRRSISFGTFRKFEPNLVRTSLEKVISAWMARARRGMRASTTTRHAQVHLQQQASWIMDNPHCPSMDHHLVPHTSCCSCVLCDATHSSNTTPSSSPWRPQPQRLQQQAQLCHSGDTE